MSHSTKYETIIGLEVHAQLLTASKMFCSCPNDYLDMPPNSVVCPICLALPGSLPVINRQAVEHVIMTGLALNSKIADKTEFHRKNYLYPDLMKGYQISQYDKPIAEGGWLAIDTDDGIKKIGITRVHLEEDVAKLQHHQAEDYSLVDVNRSGVPLMETVSEPDMRSPEEARQYLINLRSILQYLGVSTGNMEDGSFRCDANVSIRPMGSSELFTRTEIKNMNSLRAVYRALEYEVKRQQNIVETGNKVTQETRGWIEDRGVTVSQRSKESAHDYRYFPEPDLPPLSTNQEWVSKIKQSLPEMPRDRRDRFLSEYGLSMYDANIITVSKDTADFFEDTLSSKPYDSSVKTAKGKSIANWLIGDMAGLMNSSNTGIRDMVITPEMFRHFIDLIDDNVINGPAAKAVLEEMFASGKEAALVAEERGLTQINDMEFLESTVTDLLNENEQAVKDFLGGKESALGFLVGQVMKRTRGRANPALANEIILKRLNLGGKS